MEKHDQLETRVGKIEGQLESLVDSVNIFVKSQGETNRSLTEGQERNKAAILSRIDDVSKQAAPNMANMAAWATVVISVVVALGALTGFFYLREQDRNTKAIEALDVKLQREYVLMTDTMKEQVANVDRQSKERREEAQHLFEVNHTDILALQKWNQENTLMDLQELRQRRLRDGSPAKP